MGSEMCIRDSIHVVDFAPQYELLERVDVAIIHGGIGSIQQCVAQEVPMVVHRFGDVDQPGCAVRIEHHGLGRRVDLLTVTPDELQRVTDAVRTDQPTRARLKVLAQQSAAYATNAVFEKLVDRIRTQPTS